MWTPNSVQVPTSLVMKALHGEISPETMLAVLGFTTFPKWSGMSLTEQFALIPENVKAAADLLQIGSIEMEERDESPSTEIVVEEQNLESKVEEADACIKIRDSIDSRFPDRKFTADDLNKISEMADPEWVEAICVIMYENHLSGKEVTTPVPLIIWWIKNHSRDKAIGIANNILRKPRSTDSILSETLQKAKGRVPAPPQQRGSELHEKNEAVRRARGNSE